MLIVSVSWHWLACICHMENHNIDMRYSIYIILIPIEIDLNSFFFFFSPPCICTIWDCIQFVLLKYMCCCLSTRCHWPCFEHLMHIISYHIIIIFILLSFVDCVNVVTNNYQRISDIEVHITRNNNDGVLQLNWPVCIHIWHTQYVIDFFFY